MGEAKGETVVLDVATQLPDRKGGWFAAGGVIGAVFASTCCVVPLMFVMVGISGAWIGNLVALEPYKPIFAGVALLFIGLGFRQVYFDVKPACDNGSFCARPGSALITKSALWLSTMLVILAVTVNWWAPLFY